MTKKKNLKTSLEENALSESILSKKYLYDYRKYKPPLFEVINYFRQKSLNHLQLGTNISLYFKWKKNTLKIITLGI